MNKAQLNHNLILVTFLSLTSITLLPRRRPRPRLASWLLQLARTLKSLPPASHHRNTSNLCSKSTPAESDWIDRFISKLSAGRHRPNKQRLEDTLLVSSTKWRVHNWRELRTQIAERDQSGEKRSSKTASSLSRKPERPRKPGFTTALPNSLFSTIPHASNRRARLRGARRLRGPPR